MEKIASEVLVSFIGASPYLAFLTLAMYLFKDTIREWIKKPKSKQKKIFELQYHDLFITLNLVLSKVKQISFTSNGQEDSVKTKMIHKLIELKTEAMHRHFKEFLMREGLSRHDGNQLKFEISSVISNTVSDYKAKAHKIFINEYKIKPKDVDLLIDKYLEYRNDAAEGFLKRLESITMNEDYTTNYEKISAVLEIVAVSIYVIPRDAKNAMDSVNGVFLTYKN